MVGPGRLELPTPRLSSVCSNRLSYGPIPGLQATKKARRPNRSPYRTIVRRRSSGAPRAGQHQKCQQPVSAKEAQTKGSYPFEERETWTAICAIPSGSEDLHGVLRFDGHLTGAIYCSKKHGKVHTILDGRLTNSTASLERR